MSLGDLGEVTEPGVCLFIVSETPRGNIHSLMPIARGSLVIHPVVHGLILVVDD